MEVVAIESVEAAIPSNGSSILAFRLAVSHTGPFPIGNVSGIQFRRTTDLALFRQEQEGELGHTEYTLEPPSRVWAWPLGLGTRWSGNYTSPITIRNQTYDDPTLSDYQSVVTREVAAAVPAGLFVTYEIHTYWHRAYNGEERGNGTGWTRYAPRAGNAVQAGSSDNNVTNDLIAYRYHAGPIAPDGLDPAGWAFTFLVGATVAIPVSKWRRTRRLAKFPIQPPP